MSSPTTTKAPYRHADGSNCWTLNCSRNATGNAATSFGSFLQWLGHADLAAQLQRDETAAVKHFLPANRIRKGADNFVREEGHHDEFERAHTTMPKEEWDAVNYYMQYAYQKVNAALRGGRAWQDFLAADHAEKVGEWGYTDWSAEALEQQADEMVNKLDRAFAKVREMYPVTQQPLYRYEAVLPGESIDEIKSRYQPGSTVHFPAYTSTSANSNLMISTINKDWMQDKEIVVFEIVSHRGVDLHTAFGAGGGVTAEEQEVLIPRNSTFKVHRVIEAPYQTGYSTRVQERLGYYGYRDHWKKPITKKRFTIVQLIDVTE